MQPLPAPLLLKGWLKIQSTRDPRRWKERYAVVHVTENLLRWFRDESEAPEAGKSGWSMNLYQSQIIALEKLAYDGISGPKEVWDLVDPDTDSTSNSEGEQPMIKSADAFKAKVDETEDAVRELSRLMVLNEDPSLRREAAAYLE